MSHAIRMYRYGGPEVLQWEEVDLQAPGPGQVLIRHTAVGVNFIDIYQRTGLYPQPLPAGLGREATGVVEAVGEGVRNLAEGDRVAYAGGESGAYAECRIVQADRVVQVPGNVTDSVAAAVLLKGLTAIVLMRRTYRVKRGDFVLIHAAAGGVGLLAVQFAKQLGATVIGVVSSAEKSTLVRAHGADHVIIGSDDIVATVREITANVGVAVVYDSVGKDTFFGSLDCLRRFGMMVSFGNASGPVPPISPLELSRRGSLFLTRPTLFDYIADRKDLERASKELFELVGRSSLSVVIGQTYALREAASAHRDLELRRTVGSTILLP